VGGKPPTYLGYLLRMVVCVKCLCLPAADKQCLSKFKLSNINMIISLISLRAGMSWHVVCVWCRTVYVSAATATTRRSALSAVCRSGVGGWWVYARVLVPPNLNNYIINK